MNKGKIEPSQEYCDDCKALCPDEKTQEHGTPHFCKVYREFIRHNGQHPRLPRPEYCKTYKDI